MAYSYDFDSDSCFLLVRYDKSTSLSDREELLERIVQVLRDIPELKILIDVRDAENALSLEEELSYGKLLATKSEYFVKSKTAILVHGKNPHFVMQAGAYANGFRNMVEFESRSEALDWLNGDIR